MSSSNHKKSKKPHVFEMAVEEQLVKTFIGKDQVANIQDRFKVEIILIKPPEDSTNRKWTLRVTGKKLRVLAAAKELQKRHEKMYKVIMGIFQTISKQSNESLQEPLVKMDCPDTECSGCHDCKEEETENLQKENVIISHENPVK